MAMHKSKSPKYHQFCHVRQPCPRLMHMHKSPAGQAPSDTPFFFFFFFFMYTVYTIHLHICKVRHYVASLLYVPLFPFFCCFICHRYWCGKFTLTKALVRLKSMTHAWPCTMCHYFHVRFTSISFLLLLYLP